MFKFLLIATAVVSFLTASPAAASTLKLMSLTDSIGVWAPSLFQSVRESGYDVETARFSWGGYTPADLLAGKDGTPSLAEFYSGFEADVVVIHAGTNGLLSSTIAVPEGQQWGSHVQDMKNILDYLFSANPNVRIVLSQIIPRLDTVNGTSAGVSAYNDQLALMASSLPYAGQVTLVDMENLFAHDPAYYISDGVHPSDLGNELMAQTYLPAVTQSLDAVATPLPGAGLLLAPALAGMAVVRRARPRP